MAFDQALADRVRAALAKRRGIKERKMFGGIAFMLNGNMCCGVLGKDLVLRVGPDGHDRALRRGHARAMDFTGKPMRGFLYVAPKGTASSAALRSWLGLGLKFAGSLPRK